MLIFTNSVRARRTFVKLHNFLNEVASGFLVGKDRQGVGNARAVQSASAHLHALQQNRSKILILIVRTDVSSCIEFTILKRNLKLIQNLTSLRYLQHKSDHHLKRT